MKELAEAKFTRTGKEYSLKKTDTGFDMHQIDLDDKLPPVFKTFQQLLDLSKNGQIVFAGFEEKKNEAELILINCIHQAEISELKAQIKTLETDKETQKDTLLSSLEDMRKEIEELKTANALLREAKELEASTSDQQ